MPLPKENPTKMEALIPHPHCQLLSKKKLTATDVLHRLAFPVRHMGVVWPQNQPLQNPKTFQVVDQHGRTWDMVAHLRWDLRGNPKPEVYGPGWRRFLADKELKIGDELVFYHNDPAGCGAQVQLFVTVRRLVGMFRLFGEQIVTYAEEE